MLPLPAGRHEFIWAWPGLGVAQQDDGLWRPGPREDGLYRAGRHRAGRPRRLLHLRRVLLRGLARPRALGVLRGRARRRRSPRTAASSWAASCRSTPTAGCCRSPTSWPGTTRSRSCASCGARRGSARSPAPATSSGATSTATPSSTGAGVSSPAGSAVEGYRGPLPAVTNLNRPHWEGLTEHRLLVQRCSACGRTAGCRPGRGACRAGRVTSSGSRCSGRGTVTSFVRFHQQYYRDGPFEVPYAVAEVTLEEGPRLYAQLVDAEPQVGLAVEVCYEDLAPDLTVARFRPPDRPGPVRLDPGRSSVRGSPRSAADGEGRNHALRPRDPGRHGHRRHRRPGPAGGRGASSATASSRSASAPARPPRPSTPPAGWSPPASSTSTPTSTPSWPGTRSAPCRAGTASPPRSWATAASRSRPCKPADRQLLAEMMESVEDIPADAILTGLPWDWESYPEYLDSYARMPKGINVGGMVGHCSVRIAAMGDRAIDQHHADAPRTSWRCARSSRRRWRAAPSASRRPAPTSTRRPTAGRCPAPGPRPRSCSPSARSWAGSARACSSARSTTTASSTAWSARRTARSWSARSPG